MEKTRVQELAQTLDWLIKEGRIPGLLDKDVMLASEQLLAQERELIDLRAAVAANEHIVTARAYEHGRQLEIGVQCTIADPRVFYGIQAIDPVYLQIADRLDFIAHTARILVRMATAEWLDDLYGKATIAVRDAIEIWEKEEPCQKQKVTIPR